ARIRFSARMSWQGDKLVSSGADRGTVTIEGATCPTSPSRFDFTVKLEGTDQPAAEVRASLDGDKGTGDRAMVIQLSYPPEDLQYAINCRQFNGTGMEKEAVYMDGVFAFDLNDLRPHILHDAEDISGHGYVIDTVATLTPVKDGS